MYVVIELQTNEDGTLGNLVYKYDTLREAENKYHLIMASAALSNLPAHAAVILSNIGQLLATDYYTNDEEGDNN